jgi:hypothetical protein
VWGAHGVSCPARVTEQANTLLSWARATKDKAYADRLRTRAAEEVEQAEAAREAVADLNPLLAEFNSHQLLKARK